MKDQITQAQVKDQFHYDPETGHFTRIKSKRNAYLIGTIAGRTDSKGYVQIGIGGKRIFAHHLAFLYMEGALPTVDVDHDNHVRNDNSWKNLRIAGDVKNAQNRRHQSDNTSGVKGVSRLASGKWQAAINYRGKRHYLGVFDELSDAKEFIGLARDMCHGEFACHG